MGYRNSGVDIEAGYASVGLMKQYVKRTLRPEVMGGIGGFSGAFSLTDIKNMEDLVLPSGIDGVGTKLKIALLLDRHDTIGIDCAAMCVNDVACAGDEPLFFLDYIACGKNIPEKVATIVPSVAEGCVQVGCALVGGETAEHPGFIPGDEYDFAGLSTGACDRRDLITGEELKSGDVLIDTTLGGVHSNDFSLVRNIFGMGRENLTRFYPELGATLGEVLLAPTCIYAKTLKNTKEVGARIHACSHIVGGGFYENMPRMLRDGVRAGIREDSHEVPVIFRLTAGKGEANEHIMYSTFNMGVGMVVAVDPADVEKTTEAFRIVGKKSSAIGKRKAGERGIDLC